MEQNIYILELCMYAIYGIPFSILHDKTYTECLCTHFLEYKKLINIACYMFTLFSQVLQKNGTVL